MRGSGISSPPAMLTSMRLPIMRDLRPLSGRVGTGPVNAEKYQCTPKPRLRHTASGRQQRIVQCDVALCARVPAEIACHAVLLQLPPDSLVVMSGDRAFDRRQKRGTGRRSEYET